MQRLAVVGETESENSASAIHEAGFVSVGFWFSLNPNASKNRVIASQFRSRPCLLMKQAQSFWIWGEKIVVARVVTFPGAALIGAGGYALAHFAIEPSIR